MPNSPIVIKYGGNAMTEPALRAQVAADIAKLREVYAPIVVHGGGPFIGEALATAKLTSTFVRGLRVTDDASLPVIESVLTQLGKVLAQEVGNAVGLTGRDAGLLTAEPLDTPPNTVLGYVGKIVGVNKEVLGQLLALPLTPVIACIAQTNSTQTRGQRGVLNVNADSVAGAVAGAFGAPVIFLSNIPGVLDDPENSESLIPELSEREVKARIADGRIAGGMIPKVEAALEALHKGASFAAIADGREPETLRRVLAGEVGTRVVA